jgi:hypothetical protein
MSLESLQGAFGGLSEAHHQILVMRELEGLSYREIGERLGMSRPSVESTLFRARRRLSEEYEELISGARCQQIQSIIAGADAGHVGTRDERKMARHVSHCQPCRRAALAAGFEPEALRPKRTVREKLAAWLPLPGFLKRFIAPGGGDGSGWLSAAQYAESGGAGWLKLAAAASAIVVAGFGAHAVRSPGQDAPAGARDAAASSQARTSAPAGGAAQAGSPATRIVGGTSQSTTHGSTVSGKAGSGGGSSSGSGSSSAGSGSGSGSASGSAATANDPAGSGGSNPVKDLTKGVKDAVDGATGAGSGGGAQLPPVQLPPVQLPKVTVPDVPGAPKVVNDTVHAVNGVVGGATDTVNKTVDQTTGTVNGVVGQTTGAVNQTVGGATTAVGDTVHGLTGGATTASGSGSGSAPASGSGSGSGSGGGVLGKVLGGG